MAGGACACPARARARGRLLATAGKQAGRLAMHTARPPFGRWRGPESWKASKRAEGLCFTRAARKCSLAAAQQRQRQTPIPLPAGCVVLVATSHHREPRGESRGCWKMLLSPDPLEQRRPTARLHHFGTQRRASHPHSRPHPQPHAICGGSAGAAGHPPQHHPFTPSPTHARQVYRSTVPCHTAVQYRAVPAGT